MQNTQKNGYNRYMGRQGKWNRTYMRFGIEKSSKRFLSNTAMIGSLRKDKVPTCNPLSILAEDDKTHKDKNREQGSTI